MGKQSLIANIGLIFLTSAQAAGVNVFVPVTGTNVMSADTIPVALPGVEIKSEPDAKRLDSSTPYQNIDSRKIKETGITDISDAMRRLPGVNLRDYGGAGGLKTVSVRGLGSEHTSVIYDGVALSDCQSGQIDLSRYSLDNVRAITLYAGDADDIFLPAKAAASASSLYISSFTNPATDDYAPHFKAQMKFGSFGLYNPYVRFYKSCSEKFQLAGNAEYIHSRNDYPFTLRNGDITTREIRENSLMNSWHGELNGTWKVATGKSLSVKLYYYDNSRDLPGPVIYYVSKSEEHLRERNFFGHMRYKGRLSRNLSLMTIVKFNWASSRYTDVNGKYPGGMLDNHYIQRETYATASLLYIPTSGLMLDYSADWAWNNLSSNTRSAIRPYRNSILQTIAAKYTIGRLTAMARALYSVYLNGAKDGDAGKNANKLSPMVSLSFRILDGPDLFVRASYKNIFRLPTFNEAYFDNYGSINLNPENTDQYNIGFTYKATSLSWLADLTLTCDGYLNHVNNKIVAIPYNMFVWTMTNLGKVRVYGLDATVSSEFRLTDKHSILFNGSYSYQRAQVRTSPTRSDWMKQVAYIPVNSGSASLSWVNPWTNVAIHTTACGPRYTTNYNLPETKIAGYFDTGITLFRRIDFGKKSVEGRFDIINIFDRQYEIVACYPMPVRSWKLSVEFNI